MTKDLIIVALLLALIYLYYQNRKLKQLPAMTTAQQTIYELDEDLIADRDSAIRAKNEAEAEALSLGNKLKLKQQEVTRKEQEITRLKQEKSQSEIALNKKLTELKKKYSQREQLLDNEQLENNKLETKITELETKLTEQEKEYQSQLKAINLLFDDQAKDYQTIDFNGLYSLLTKLANKNMPGSF